MSFWRWIRTMLKDQRGDGDPAAGGGQAGAPAAGGEGAAPGADEGVGGEGGQGGEPPATPKYGEFGDSPTVDDIFAAFQKTKEEATKFKTDFEGIKTKTTATEQNLSGIRKALDAIGIQATKGADGQLQLQMKEQAKQRQSRFNDTHKSLFDQKVLEAIELRVQDLLDEKFESYNGESEKKRQQMQAFVAERDKHNNLLISFFPQLQAGSKEQPNEQFNEAFYDRATQIWEENYNSHPLKQLQASMEAAIELKIPYQSIVAAKKEGIVQGKNEKKILGPAGQGAGAKGAGKGKLSKDEYMKLSPDERVKYDKNSLGI